MNIIRLNLFQFSLKDKTKTWLQNLRSGSVRTRNNKPEQFLKPKYQILSKDNSPLSLKRQERFFTNVGIGIRNYLIFAYTMVLNHEG